MKKNWKYGRKILLLALPLCLTVAMTSLAEKSTENTEETSSYDTDVTLATPSQPQREEVESETEIEAETETDEIALGLEKKDVLSSIFMVQEEEEKFFPATDLKWDEKRPGWVTWSMEGLTEEEQEAFTYVAIRLYRDGEFAGYQQWRNLGESDLRSHIQKSGKYQFQVVLCKGKPRGGEISEYHWSEISEPYNFSKETVLKKMPKPEKVEISSNGILRWKAGSEKEVNKKADSYIVNVYVKSPSGEYELREYDTAYEESTNYLYLIDDGVEECQFEVIAMGDLITYGHSDPSERVTFTVKKEIGTGKDVIGKLNKGDIEKNIEQTKLSTEEKTALQTAIQMSVNAADGYTELEVEYISAAGKSDLLINHDNSIITEQPIVTGAVLNGATGIKFEKSSSIKAGYGRQLAIEITLEGSKTSGELDFPVLITMAVPDGIDPWNMVIVHKKHNGTEERIYPRVNDDETVSFAVTQFSPFIFIDESSKETGSSNGSNSSGGRFVSSQKSGGASKAPETPGQWQQTDAGWQFRKPSGELYQNTWVFAKGKWYWIEPTSVMAQGWKELNGKKYYLLPVSGEMKTGWLLDNNSWYYLEESGAMKTGWTSVNGKWYYLNADGKMASDTVTPDGYKVGADGAWMQ
ncbi:hypothetical protein AALB39_25870 [Lachnospiraceae bacterium 54-53]